ncbi:MAG: 8-oxo-dGTP diphosphatase [Oligoflexia bacterium]|nr:8-oxo-dGTP diphosphatase [Oligoflexia bacterium]
MNPFETGARKLIPAVLIYLKSRDERFLMIHRNSKEGDYHQGKWNGLGGKLEADESALEAARRELTEESGFRLPAEAFVSLGTVHFPNFKAHKSEDWLVFVWMAHLPRTASEAIPAACDEGSLHWVPKEDLLKLNLWEGDRHFLPLVLAERPFQGTIWYQGEKVIRHEGFPL